MVEYPSQSVCLTLLFNLYVVSWWLEVAKRVDLFAQIRFEFLLGAVLGGIAMTRIGQDRHVNPAKKKIFGGIGIYFLSLSFSLAFSQHFAISWELFLNRILKLFVMTLFINVYVRSPQQLWYFLISTFIAFFKVGQEAFIGKIVGSMVWENQGIMRLHGSPGTMFGHPNSLAGKTVSLLPYLWTIFGLLKKYWKLLLFIQLVFSVNIIIFTGSRTGYLATCILLVAFFLNSKNKFKMFMVLIALAVVVVFTLPEQYKGRFMSSFSSQEAEGRSKDTRLCLLKDSIQVFLDNPLGVGMGCFVVMQARAGRNEQGTHNLYTQILSEIGIQGFLAFGYFIYAVVSELLTFRKKISEMIQAVTLALQHKSDRLTTWYDLVHKELKTLKLLDAVCSGTLFLILMRAVLGVFGHDLYEIYWWVAAGLAITISNLLVVIEQRVNELLLIRSQ